MKESLKLIINHPIRSAVSNFQKIGKIVLVSLLLIQLVVGTPFLGSIADEIPDSQSMLQDIIPVENTIGSQDITTLLPLTEVSPTYSSISNLTSTFYE
jgi:hypothetical protein